MSWGDIEGKLKSKDHAMVKEKAKEAILAYVDSFGEATSIQKFLEEVQTGALMEKIMKVAEDYDKANVKCDL